MKKTLILIIISGFFLLRNIACASEADIGTTVGQFLKIGAGARATSMGEAYTALADDAYCLYWNPAGLSRADRREISFTYLSYLQGIKYSYLGFIHPTKWGYWGESLTCLFNDNLDGFDSQANETGKFSARDIALSLSSGQQIKGGKVAIGETLRLIKMRIEAEEAQGLSLDLGAHYRANVQGLNFGAAVRNIPLAKLRFVQKKESLPLTLQVGAAYQLSSPDIKVALDITVPQDNKAYLNFGTEYWLQDTLAARLGWRGESRNKGSKFTVGFGYKFGLFSVDYANEGFGDLGQAHHISFQYRF